MSNFRENEGLDSNMSNTGTQLVKLIKKQSGVNERMNTRLIHKMSAHKVKLQLYTHIHCLVFNCLMLSNLAFTSVVMSIF